MAQRRIHHDCWASGRNLLEPRGLRQVGGEQQVLFWARHQGPSLCRSTSKCPAPHRPQNTKEKKNNLISKNDSEKCKKKKVQSLFWIDFFIPRFNEATSDGQESARMTDFDHMAAHFFGHLPSLGALGGWQPPLWWKNMPSGKCTALWRALLNYPKTFSSCTFITPRKDKQGERHAFKDRRSRSDVMVDWLRCGFKRTSAQSRSVSSLFGASSNRMIYSISTGCQANISSELSLSLRMTQTAEQPKPTNQRGLTPFALDSSSSVLGILEFHLTSLTKEKLHGNNNWLYILLPALKKFPPQKAEMQIVCLRSFAQMAGIKNIFSCSTYANKSLYYANHVHLIFT